MATVIEIQETKVEGLCEQAEKVMKHTKKLMECLETLKHEGSDDYYTERYNRRRGGKYNRDDYENEYYRY